ncbi:hypothetical protein F8280_04750 [Micromonospora noduli]|uniref:hypothetical protein n=1 Tax=Micromonospora noduli TaxID=709876 RepID=UPI00124B8B1A|nr:hypothetical protein [Micromonospora noduli]KAB1928059.1 hypothetical protein F8280_04750 [Micromonospora noduli]
MKDRGTRSSALSLLPLSTAAVYAVVLVVLAEALSGRAEAVASGCWWVVSAVGVGWLGRLLALRSARLVPVGVLAVAVPVVASPLAFTSLLGEHSIVALAVLAIWAVALVIATVLVEEIPAGRARRAAVVAVGLGRAVVLGHLPGRTEASRLSARDGFLADTVGVAR